MLKYKVLRNYKQFIAFYEDKMENEQTQYFEFRNILFSIKKDFETEILYFGFGFQRKVQKD